MNESFEDKDFRQADSLIRKRQRFSRRARKASTVIGQLLSRNGYGQQQSANEIENVWIGVIDPKWNGKTKVGNIRNGILEVFVASHSAVQHLNFQKATLLKKLQQRLPQNKLTDIRFRVGPTS